MKARDFNVVFTPRDKAQYNGKKRFLVSLNQLSKYMGPENANRTVLRLRKSFADKTTIKLRTRGKFEFYSK